MGVEIDPRYVEEIEKFSEEQPQFEKPADGTAADFSKPDNHVVTEYDPIAFLKDEIREQEKTMAEADNESVRSKSHVMFGMDTKEHDASIKQKQAEKKEVSDQALLRAGELNRIVHGLESGDPQAVQEAKVYFTERIEALEKEFNHLEEEIKAAAANCDEMRRLEQAGEGNYGVAEYDDSVNKIGLYIKEISALEASRSGVTQVSGKTGMTNKEMKIEIGSLEKSRMAKGYGFQAHRLMDAQRRMNEIAMRKEKIKVMRNNLDRLFSGQEGVAEVA